MSSLLMSAGKRQSRAELVEQIKGANNGATEKYVFSSVDYSIAFANAGGTPAYPGAEALDTLEFLEVTGAKAGETPAYPGDRSANLLLGVIGILGGLGVLRHYRRQSRGRGLQADWSVQFRRRTGRWSEGFALSSRQIIGRTEKMQYLGELISLGVACSWTVAALACEIGSKRMGVFVLNVWRMGVALLLSLGLMWLTLGSPYPVYASGPTWWWLLLSGVVGYFFGDWCLFNSYVTIGSRYGQLFMTLAPMFTALTAWTFLGQTLSWSALLAMCVTMLGIAISVLGRSEGKGLSLALPTKGVLFGIGAALGQGLGLVLSKIGVDSYVRDVPLDAIGSVEAALPFAGNGIRCVAGLVCFTAWLVLSGQAKRLRASIHDRRGMAAMIVAVLSGPFIGVGFSLMAVQYTAAGIASTLMSITPILILWPSHRLFGQPITVRGVVGAVISVVGVSLFFLL